MLGIMIAMMLVGGTATLIHGLTYLVIGVAAVTFGFFGSHSMASTWLTRRAGVAKGQASALYLFFYYIGASIAGPIGGMGWQASGWSGVVHILWAILGVGALLCAVVGRDAIAPSQPK
jgi:YNFM family putative membrane transporter